MRRPADTVDLEMLRCPVCTSMITPQDVRCPSCGKRLPAPASTASSAAPAPRPVAPEATTPRATGSPTAPADPWATPPAGGDWGLSGSVSPPIHQIPAQPYGGYPTRRDSVAYSVAGIICGALALMFCPIVLGGIGLFLAKKAKQRGESLAGVARTVSLVGLIGGIIVGMVLTLML